MTAPTIGVGMVGYGFMGRAHSQALRTVAGAFDPPLRPEMVTLCGRDEARVSTAAARLGWRGHDTDWQALVQRDDVSLVIVGTPGHTHAEIAVAALDAGKHVLCEKPLANSLDEAKAMVVAAERAAQRGVRSMVAHNYRRVPALELARRLVERGEIGMLRHVRVAYLQDWLADADVPTSWRTAAELAGSGALGDIGSHAVDIAQHVAGQRIESVTARLSTFVGERPVAASNGERAAVTVDDAAAFLAQLSGGAVAAFEVTRMATGRKNSLSLELYGSEGSLAFDLERLNELELFERAEPPAAQGFRRVLVTEPEHPWMAAWWPPGHTIGWEHLFTHQLDHLLRAIAAGEPPSPSFADGLAVQAVLDAVARSSTSGRWETPTLPPPTSPVSSDPARSGSPR